MEFLTAKVVEWAVIAGSIIATIVGIWLGGRASGRRAEETKRLREQTHAARTRAEVDRDVARGDAAEQLRKDWSR